MCWAGGKGLKAALLRWWMEGRPRAVSWRREWCSEVASEVDECNPDPVTRRLVGGEVVMPAAQIL